MKNNLKIVAGLDIGNGYVKGTTKGLNDQPISIDLPSSTAYVMNPVDVPVAPEKISSTIDDIFNQMDLSFDTPLLKGIDGLGRRLFGKRGLSSGHSIRKFTIDAHVSKAEQPLSYVLILGCIAGTALKDYYKTNKALPTETLRVESNMGIALPITEYKKYREAFANKFTSYTHMVTFHNFEQPVRMEIVFTDVQVLAEGASAQYAIVSQGASLMDLMLNDVRSRGVELYGIVSDDILQAENTIGIDIGEGTVNFPVFTNGIFNTDASETLAKGWGTVLENSLAPLASANLTYDNRKALAEDLQKTPTALNKAKLDRVRTIVAGEAQNFAKELVDAFSRVMSSSTQVVYVYGGGATAMKELIYNMLQQAVIPYVGDYDFPILYLDSTYSRYLNKQGLFEIANNFAK